MPATDAFYEAAIVPELWGRALDLASAAWGADGGILLSYANSLGGLIHSDALEEFCTRFFDEDWEARDVRTQRGIPLARKGKEIVTDADLVTADELRKLPLYSEFLPSVGFGWFAGTILMESGGANIALSLHRRAKREPFSKDDLSLLRHDLPHVRRAARLASKARLSYAEGLVDGLERFTCGAILIDWLGRVIRLNGRAEAYLGEHLQIVSSRLRSPEREANKALQDLITACTRSMIGEQDDGPNSALLHRANGLPFLLHSYPVARAACDIFQGARAILLITDPTEDRTLALTTVREIFQLTPAELRVASALLKGLDTQQIANENEVGTQTVRYHLKSIFAKTGTNHQAQLVSLLSRFSERS
ncbi:helix-turn-helix transcriptional regulator [Microvirga sp. VF16]|uniref:helix-turn-helix transcriptional regulator n=1 Tax=Microvirga sp. VF16 TaxID=2807101 RepID=UPI00193D99DA|nr:helix-turn-helix transcriptional regulator [Microvirga sp. VF16]QRM31159.1 helix-turn-helix transcriptional regulator [Microvirga sp. VF16]